MAEKEDSWSDLILFLAKLCLCYDTGSITPVVLCVPSLPHGVDGSAEASSSQALSRMCQTVLERHLELYDGDVSSIMKQEWEEVWAVLKCLQHVR